MEGYTAMDAKKWYLASCKVRQESRAKEHLDNQDIDSYLPTIQMEKIVRGKRTQVTEALFPGYIFIYSSTEDPSWHRIRSTRGIRDFVRFGGKISPVPEQLIKDVQSLVKTGLSDTDDGVPQQGDLVKISSGPFAGLEGVFQMANGDERSIVLLNILGNQSELIVENSNIQKL